MKKKKSIRGSLIPDLTVMAMPNSYESLPIRELKIPKDPVKHKDPVVTGSTLKELKAECKKRKLPTSGTKSVLTKRIKVDDERIFEEKRLKTLRIETEHRRKIDEENEMIQRIFDNKIASKQSELKSLRNEIVAAYIKLRRQQNVCGKLDRKAEELRATIKVLKEG